MFSASFARLMLLVAVAPPTAADASASVRAAPEPIATRQSLFAIPFQIDEPMDPSRRPVEVQLYVSADRGASWQLYSKAPPTRRQFVFRAAGDGEFWFLVRTLDQSGQLWPRENSGPELRVAVDTTPPKLELKAHQAGTGQIVTRWQIDESNFDPASLKIQYRTDNDTSWQSVALDRGHAASGDARGANEVAWMPPAGSRQIQIRAEVADKAGNPSVNHAHVDLLASRPLETSISPAGTSGAGPQRPDSPGEPATTPSGPLTAQSNPPLQNQYIPPAESKNQWSTTPEAGSLSPGRKPQMVNSRRFELDYADESFGPSGVAKVELWATRDGGQTWGPFAVDDDGRSPMVVQVDQEGVYGFRIVPTSSTGVREHPPKAGDPPDVAVGVDLTQPTARILGVEPGTGPDSGRLVVRWQAADQMLADRPVSISVSENPSGPWTAIATGLENSGRYLWAVDGRAPGAIYVRLEVRDEAGNVAACETTESVAGDWARPSVRIRNVRPLGDSAWKPPKRYYFR